MIKYHKIQTVFKRSPESNFKELMEGEYSLPEFKMLKDIEWVWTEKIDGTNIRVMWDGINVRFGGKTDDAQIPTFLLKVLQDIFTIEKMAAKFGTLGNTEVCLYGEGYGAKIQKGGNYLPNSTNFILFDCKVDKWWLRREALEELAKKLEIGIVPIIGTGTLEQAIEYCRKGFKSTIAENKDYPAEGLVLKPVIDLFDRAGNRIVSKIKIKDFIK